MYIKTLINDKECMIKNNKDEISNLEDKNIKMEDEVKTLKQLIYNSNMEELCS